MLFRAPPEARLCPGAAARELLLEPRPPPDRRFFRLARPLLHESEGARGLLHEVLVELRELEPDGGVRRLVEQRLEVGERPRAVPARLGDVTAHAPCERTRPPLDRGVRRVLR